MNTTKKQTLYKDKIIMVFYIDIGNLNHMQAEAHVNNIRALATPEHVDDSVVMYFIPVRDQKTEIVCINPQFVEFDTHNKDLITKIEKVEKLLERYDNINFIPTREVLNEHDNIG